MRGQGGGETEQVRKSRRTSEQEVVILREWRQVLTYAQHQSEEVTNLKQG